MTVTVANTALTNTWDFLRQRLNEAANALTTKAVTVSSNAAVGNAVVSGTIQSLLLSTNSLSGVASVNSTGAVVTTLANLHITSGLMVSNTQWVLGTLSIGNTATNTSINTTAIATQVGLVVGNTATNTSINTTALSTSGGLYIGNTTVNTHVTPGVLRLGNTTVNTVINSSSVTVNGAVVLTTATSIKIYYANSVQA